MDIERLEDSVVKESFGRPAAVEAVVEGDGRVPSISAASIIAKVLHIQYISYTCDIIQCDGI